MAAKKTQTIFFIEFREGEWTNDMVCMREMYSTLCIDSIWCIECHNFSEMYFVLMIICLFVCILGRYFDTRVFKTICKCLCVGVCRSANWVRVCLSPKSIHM